MKTYLLPFLVLLSFSITINLNAQEESDYGLLWKIEKEGMADPSYLFGTMHVQDERAFNFSDSVMINLESCSQFAMELHPDSMMSAMYDKMFDTDTTDYFKKYLSEEEYSTFVEKFNKDKGYKFEDLENKNPVAIKALTKRKSSFKSDRSTFVDMHLCGVAKTYGKSIHGLEEPDNQFLYLKESAIQEIRMYLYADSLDMQPHEKQLAETYEAGDMKNMEKMLGKRTLEDPHFVKRNTDMVESMVELMDTAPTFSAIGAAHLIGEKSVIAMLEEKGYKVSKVKATFTGVADTYEVDPSMFPWQPFINEDAGVMLDFPGHSKYLKQSYEHPDDPNLDSMDIHIWLCSDLTNMTNYLFAYNDFPSGYYIDDLQVSFDEAINELLATSERLSPTTTIYKNGVEGRQLDINIKEITYARLQIFIRGNRMYKFLIQNLNQGEELVPENKFLSNVQFLPYKSSDPMMNTTASDLIDFMEFSTTVSEPDTVIDNTRYAENNVYHYSVNNNTGGLYTVVSEKMMKYYREESQDSFYNMIANDLMSYTDTIIRSKSITLKGYTAKDFVIKDIKQESYKRFRLSLFGDQFIMQSAFADSTELWSSAANKFFDGIKFKQAPSDFDLTSSKSDLILKDLRSTDTLAYQKALGAVVNYYYFKQDEMLDLQEAVAYHYSRDTSNSGVASTLINEIALLKDSTQVEFLQDIYLSNDATAEVKCELLKTILSLGDTSTYLALFFEDIPNELSSGYQLMSPFTDSLERAAKYYDQLLPLAAKETYRYNILSLSYAMLSGESTAAQDKVKENYEQLIAYRTEDLREYQKEHLDEDSYFWPSKIHAYMYLSEQQKDDSLVMFLDEVVAVDSSDLHLKNMSMASKFAHNYEVDQGIMDSLLNTDYYIYDVIASAINHDQEALLPDSLQAVPTQIFYKAKDHLLSDDVATTKFELLGTTIVDNNEYYVYNFSDEYYYGEKDNNYILLVGGSGKKKSFSTKDAKSYYFEISKDETKQWKEKAKANMDDFEKYAY